MNLFVKGEGEIHGKEILTLSADLFYAADLITKNGKGDKFSLAYGEHENLLFSEVKSEDIISMAILDTKKKVLRGFRMAPSTRYSDSKPFSDENLEDRIAVDAIVMQVAHPSLTDFTMFENTHSGMLSESDEFDLNSIMMGIETVLINKIYSKQDDGLSAITKPVQAINISLVETGMLNPSKVVFGRFEGFKPATRKRAGIKLSEIKDKFVLNPERAFSQEEKEMMFNIPSYYAVSSNVVSIAEKIKTSWDKDPNLRKVNVLMEGPAGTGKTLDSKVLSRLLGLPYTKITCFADMDSSDVTGAILPVANEEIELPMPSDDEIYFDPAGCWERITGKKVEEGQEITEADVREAINEAYESFYASQEGKNSPRYVYYASEIVKAFENGWLCEIQERARRS